MKHRALLFFIVAFVAGCTSKYEIAQPGEEFLSHWNASVPSEGLQLKSDSQGDYASKNGDILLLYRTGSYGPSWMLISTVEPEGNMVCTELLIASTKMSYDHATSMVEATATRKSIKDGNLEFRMNRGGGGVSCNVSLTKT